MRLNLRSFVLVGVLAGSPLSFAQTTRYVSSVTGEDTNPGTEAAPFRTLQHCIEQWDGVAQYECRGAGTFHEELVIVAGGPSPAERNRLMAWDTDGDGDLGDETFILDGQSSRNVAIQVETSTHNVEIAYLHVRDYEPDGGCGDGGQLHHIRFFCWSGCNDWWIHHNRFERLGMACDWSTGGSSYISIMPRGVPRLLLEDNVFDTIGGYVMRYFAGNDITIRNNLIGVVSTGLKVWDVQPSLDGHGIERLLIEGNTFACDGNGGNAPTSGCLSQSAVALADDCIDTTIRENVFTDCVSSVSIATDDAFGAVAQTGILVERNRSTVGPAVCNDWSASFLGVNDCSGLSTHTGEPLLVQGLTVRNNVMQRTGGGIRQHAIRLASGHPFPFSNDIVLENNTIRGYHEGIRLDECGGQQHQLDGVTIRNNVFAEIEERIYSIWSGGAPANWSSDDNTFTPGAAWNWTGTWLFDAWKANTGQDARSRECDPTFVGPGDPHLDATDTCARDNGRTLSSFADDFEGDGRPSGAAWDIGADEEAGPPCTSVTSVLAVKAGAPLVDVLLSWAVDPAAESYSTWVAAAKTGVPEAREGGPWPSVADCYRTVPPTCTDADAVPGASGTGSYYQVRAVCGGVEVE